jgi:predicted small metal-binding protein
VEYDFRCSTAGAKPCGFRTQANDENELRAQIERHFAEVHHVNPPTKTIMNYLVRTATDGAPSCLQ